MDLAYEVLVIGGKRCFVYDAAKLNYIAEYNVGFQDGRKPFTPKTLALLNDHFMIGAVGKHIRTWRINGKDAKSQTVSLVPGNVTALTVTSCGTYCVAAIQNCLYIWQVMSGELLSKVSINEQDISCLKFTSDNSLLVVGYKSGHVVICFLSQLIGVQVDTKSVDTLYKWNHHAAEVTDIYAGCLGACSRLATTSLDMTCKLYELDTGILLTTICLDVPLLSVIMDHLEYYIFLGDDSGNIYKINLFERMPRELHYDDEHMTKVKGHESKVLAMSFSLEGNIFMSLSEEICKIWSMEHLAVLTHVKLDCDQFTNAFLALRPAGLSEREIHPPFSIPVFQRNKDCKDQRACDGSQTKTLREAILSSQKLSLAQGFRRDEIYTERTFDTQKSPADLLHPVVKESLFLETLHGDNISELRHINNQMYCYMVNKAMESLPHSSHD